jgi:hypothetical protein
MHSSTSSFERLIPAQPWRGLAVVVVTLVLVATLAWEVYCRSLGYEPCLNDTADLWAQVRNRVQPGSIVIVGDSRPWFDCDLDELQRGLGSRPLQLAQAGSCAFPVFDDLVKDEKFHGTIICSVVPIMFFAPGGPLLEPSEKAIKRYHNQTVAQWASHLLGIPLEEHVAFLKQGELDTPELLRRLRIPDRPGALVPPIFPPYFGSVDRERRARMIERAARPGELQSRIAHIWLPLFTPPPPPTYVPKDKFFEQMKAGIEKRFKDMKADVEKFRARGGKVVFVRFPVSGELKQLEDKQTPRAGMWDRLLKETAAPGIYFEDYPELAGFTCPEWSHLSDEDSVEFSRRLVPHLRKALETESNQKPVAARD